MCPLVYRVARPHPLLVPPSAAHRRVDLALLVMAAVWGSSYLSAKVAVAAGGVLVVLALRYAISAGALAAVAAARRPRRPDRAQVGVGVALGCSQAAVLVLETYGIASTSATHAGVLIALTIVITPAMQGALSRAPLPARFYAAAALATVGVIALVAGPGPQASVKGDSLILVAALVRSAHVAASGHLTRGREHDTVTLTLLQMLVGAVIFTFAAAPALPDALGDFGPGQWAAVVWLALGCSVFAFLTQLWAIRRTSAARASLLLGTEPLWAVAIGLLLGGEHLGVLAALGAGAVLAGTWWGQRIETGHRSRAHSTAKT